MCARYAPRFVTDKRNTAFTSVYAAASRLVHLRVLMRVDTQTRALDREMHSREFLARAAFSVRSYGSLCNSREPRIHDLLYRFAIDDGRSDRARVRGRGREKRRRLSQSTDLRHQVSARTRRRGGAGAEEKAGAEPPRASEDVVKLLEIGMQTNPLS